MKEEQEEAARKVFSPENLPIDDPFAEKNIIERDDYEAYSRYLIKKLESALGTLFSRGEPGPYFTRESLEERIAEVYRRCYSKDRDLQALGDFVAYYPALAFASGWIAELIRQQMAFLDPAKGSLRVRLLSALAQGFKRAADPKARQRRFFRQHRVQDARFIQKAIQREFKNFLGSLYYRDAPEDEKPEMLESFVRKYAGAYSEFAADHPSVFEKVNAFLEHGQARKASVLLVHKLMKVPVHVLESKPTL